MYSIKPFKKVYTSHEISPELCNCHYSFLLVYLPVWAPKPIHSKKKKKEKGQPDLESCGLLGSDLEDFLQPPKSEMPPKLKKKMKKKNDENKSRARPCSYHISLTFPTPSMASPTLGLFHLFQFRFSALQFFTCFQPHGHVLWLTAYLAISDMALDYKQPSSRVFSTWVWGALQEVDHCSQVLLSKQG